MHQWHWGENSTRRRIQSGLTLTCDGRWNAHKFQDDDVQSQNQGSWAGRPLFDPPPSPLSSFPPPPPPPSPRPLRDTDSGFRYRRRSVPLCSSASLRAMPFLQGEIGPLFYPSKPSAGLVSSLSSPFEYNSKYRHVHHSPTNRSFLLTP